MTYRKGDDVLVNFAGQTHPGEVIEQHANWVLCRIRTDPTWDYGSLSDRLDPNTTVCVRETNVRHTNQTSQNTTQQ